MKTSDYKISRNGLKFYTEVPEGFRKAMLEDFMVLDGRIKMNKAYLIGSFYNNKKFIASRTNLDFPWDGFGEFLRAGKVYVLGRK